MITHHFEKFDGVVLAGYFTDDIGRRLSSWTWNGEMIDVTAASKMRRRVLSESERSQYSDEELAQWLIDTAKSIAEELRGTPFE